ncbi:MAG: DUF4430 domain-containing protein [Oscillospiraceae bacterium]|nr:DUF4430 domain-containing protein [Oscillospiraceae bacterium]
MKRSVRMLCLFLPLCLLLTACGGKTQTVTVPDTNGDGRLTCTLEIRCDTILDNLSKLTAGKQDLVPADGLLLDTGEIEFESGDSVFDVLKREITSRKLHFEYEDGTAYGAVYIEGICNLYEFDCGPQSGWMYSVNSVFPSLGCSSYTLADGDQIHFLYTCDLGDDVGGGVQK